MTKAPIKMTSRRARLSEQEKSQRGIWPMSIEVSLSWWGTADSDKAKI
jgi:hypothetical protein